MAAAALIDKLKLLNGILEQGLPFPGFLGRPSTYKEIRSVELTAKRTGTSSAISKPSTEQAIVRPRRSRTARSETFMLSGETVSSDTVYKVVQRRLTYKEQKEQEEKLTAKVASSSKPAENDEEYSSDEEEQVPVKKIAPVKISELAKTTRVISKATTSTPIVVKITKKQVTIVDKYKALLAEHKGTKTDVELEIRFNNVSSRVFNMLKHKHIDMKTTESVDEYSGRVRKIVSGGMFAKVMYIEKTTTEMEKFDGYRISLGTETIVQQSTFAIDTVRAKTRHSAIVGPHSEYVLDLTEVETTKYDGLQGMGADRPSTVRSLEIELEVRHDIPMESIPTLDQMKEFAESLGIHNYFDVLTEVGKLINRSGINLHRLLVQAISLSKPDYYEKLARDGYFMTNKLNGTRTMVYISKKKSYVVTAPDNLHSTSDVDIDGTYVLDCELYEGEVYVIDVVYPEIDGNIVQRMEKVPAGYKKKEYQFVRKPEDIKSAVDRFYYKSISDGIDIDGLILADTGKRYFATNNYKWKPVEQETIDFGFKLVRKVLDKYEYIMYVMIHKELAKSLGLHVLPELVAKNQGEYIKIQFSPALDPVIYKYTSTDGSMEGTIYEMARKNYEWVVNRPRRDKQTPNDYRVAESVLNNHYNEFKIEMLWNPPEESYYPLIKKELGYKTYFSVMRHLFAQIFFPTKGSGRGEVDLDIGTGNGGDLVTYYKHNVAKVLAVEPDVNAATNLVMRRYPDKKYISKNHTNVVIDISTFGAVYDPELPSIYKEVYGITRFDRVIANMSAHYFMDTEEKVDIALKQVGEILKSGGSFFITGLDEAKVTKEIKLGNPVRFHIKPLGDKTIDVLMPFSGEMKRETPVHYEWLQKYGDIYGFTVTKRELRPDNNDLTADEHQYVGLHVVYILTKE